MAAVNHRLPAESTISYPLLETIGYMIGDRLSELRREAGMTQPEFAAIAGTSKQYLGRLEKGLNKDPNPKFIEKWARHFRVRMEWITTGKLPKEAAADPADSDWGDVLAYSQAAGLGTSGPEAQEYASTNKLKFRKDSLARKRLNPENLRVMYGDGDSMEPRIQAHDAILFDISDTAPKQGGVYVILTPGAGAEEYNVKRCLMSAGRAYFVADNLEGDHDWKAPRPMDDPNYPIKIVGRVKWIGGWVS